MDQSRKKVEYLVVDTSAFIKNVQLQEIGENLMTVPEVIKEIKSKPQLKRLAVLPYDLVLKDTFPEHVKFVTEFAKKTGDYPSLSATDIQVIALTYQMEKEKVGIEHLNKCPVQKTVIESEALPSDVKNIAGFYVPRKFKNGDNADDRNGNINSDDEENGEDESGSSVYDSAEEDVALEFHDIRNENAEAVAANVESVNKECSGTEGQECEQEEETAEEDEDGDEEAGYDEDEEDSDDESGWITPSNIKEVKNKMSHDILEDATGTVVACLTTDFAMQNVLKQIGLKVMTLEGKLIKELRTFILRCYGCFKTTSIMTKVFCPNCGNKTLKRVAVSLNPDGTQKLHINFRKPLTARGKKYSLPTFRGGKHSRNPVLSADQPVPQQRISKMSRRRNNPLDDEYVAGYSPFLMRDVTSKSAMLGLRPNAEVKHWMRKNPNEARPNRKKSNKNR